MESRGVYEYYCDDCDLTFYADVVLRGGCCPACGSVEISGLLDYIYFSKPCNLCGGSGYYTEVADTPSGTVTKPCFKCSEGEEYR